jgi:lysozyme
MPPNGQIQAPSGATLDSSPDLSGLQQPQPAPAGQATPSQAPSPVQAPPGAQLDTTPDVSGLAQPTAQPSTPSADTGEDEGFFSNLLSGIGVTSNQQAKDFFEHPINTLMNYFKGQGTLALQAREAYRQGDYMGALRKGLNYLNPFIGQQLDQAGDQLVQGHYAAGIGRTLGVGMVSGLMTPEGRAATGQIAGVPARALGAVREALPRLGQATQRVAAGPLPDIVQAGGVVPGVGSLATGTAAGIRLAGRIAGKFAPEAEEADPLAHQPYIQEGIKDQLSQAADDAGVARPGPDTLVRDWAEEVAESIRAKAQSVYDRIDEATQDRFSQVDLRIKQINRAMVKPENASEAAQERLFNDRAALQAEMEELFEDARKANIPDAKATVDQARAAWKQMSALNELDANIKNSMPHHLQTETTEEVDPQKFLDKVGAMRDERSPTKEDPRARRLDDAFGGDKQAARDFLSHARESYRLATSGEAPATPTAPGAPKVATAPTAGVAAGATRAAAGGVMSGRGVRPETPEQLGETGEFDEDRVFRQIADDENFVKKPYQDRKGISVGYGTSLTAHGVGQQEIDRMRKEGISREDAENLAREDIRRVNSEIQEKMPWTQNLDAARQEALVNMGYNMGTRGLMGFKKFLGDLQAGNYEEASKEMMRSDWAKQVGNRARRLSAQIRSGEAQP